MSQNLFLNYSNIYHHRTHTHTQAQRKSLLTTESKMKLNLHTLFFLSFVVVPDELLLLFDAAADRDLKEEEKEEE